MNDRFFLNIVILPSGQAYVIKQTILMNLHSFAEHFDKSYCLVIYLRVPRRVLLISVYCLDPKQPIYVKQSLKSGCCSGPNQVHEQCNCKANVEFCKDACDHDTNCKGYVVHGKSYCQIATTSKCPTTNGCAKFQIGNVVNSALDGSISCGSGYQGCNIAIRFKPTG